MSDQWANPFYVDGDFTIPVACSLPALSSPISATTAEYVLMQDWTQSRKTFAPTPLNTGHPSSGMTPDYSAFKLVSEGPRNDTGGGIVKWTRTYAKQPASHDEFESYAYPYIGFVGTFSSSGGTIATGRPRASQLVTSRVRNDYFLVGSGQAYATAGAIPIIRAQGYYAGATPGPAEAIVTDYITDGFTSTETGDVIPATVPSRTLYNHWINDANNFVWAGGSSIYASTPGFPGQIVAEDSRLSRWMGNIYCRQIRYVLAQ